MMDRKARERPRSSHWQGRARVTQADNDRISGGARDRSNTTIPDWRAACAAPRPGYAPTLLTSVLRATFASRSIACRFSFLVKHDLFGKPETTFPDHAFCWSMIFSENRKPLFRIML